MTYKGLLLRLQQNLKDPAKRPQLLKDANELRDKSEELRQEEAGRRVVAYVRDFRKSSSSFDSGRRTGCRRPCFFRSCYIRQSKILSRRPFGDLITAFFQRRNETV